MVPGLENPYPLGLQLPGMYQEDGFAQRFVSGLDDVIAPVLSTLDCIDSYFDPALAPPDFLRWLAGWIAVDLDETWSIEQQREAVSSAAGLHERRGTVSALREALRVATGADPDIEESGGASWSPIPGGDLPGEPDPRLHVRLRGAPLSESRIAALVAEHAPAHVPCTVEMESSS